MKRIAMISLAAGALLPLAAAAAHEPRVAPAPAPGMSWQHAPAHGAMPHHRPGPGMHARPLPGPHCQHPCRVFERRIDGPMGHNVTKRIIRRHHGINTYPGYHRIDRGFVVPHHWWGPQFHVMNWGGYGLPQPMHGRRWVRYYDDALLIDGYGRVHDGRWGMKWDDWEQEWAYDDRGIPVYVGNGDFHPGPQDYAWVEGQGGAYAHHGYGYPGYGYGYGHAYGYGAGMVITETTTTTAPTVIAETVYEDVEIVETARKRVHRPKAKRYRPKPRPAPVLPGERG